MSNWKVSECTGNHINNRNADLVSQVFQKPVRFFYGSANCHFFNYSAAVLFPHTYYFICSCIHIFEQTQNADNQTLRGAACLSTSIFSLKKKKHTAQYCKVHDIDDKLSHCSIPIRSVAPVPCIGKSAKMRGVWSVDVSSTTSLQEESYYFKSDFRYQVKGAELETSLRLNPLTARFPQVAICGVY